MSANTTSRTDGRSCTSLTMVVSVLTFETSKRRGNINVYWEADISSMDILRRLVIGKNENECIRFNGLVAFGNRDEFDLIDSTRGQTFQHLRWVV